jgi:hypothetical protein
VLLVVLVGFCLTITQLLGYFKFVGSSSSTLLIIMICLLLALHNRKAGSYFFFVRTVVIIIKTFKTARFLMNNNELSSP